MATSIPKYVQNKDVWNKLVKPDWVGSFSGGGANPVRLDLKNGKVFSAADVASVPDAEKPYVLVNKRYVDGELVYKAGKAEFDALQNFTTTQIATLNTKVETVPDIEWDEVVNKPVWTSDFEGGNNTHIVVGNSINMGDNVLYGLPKPLAGSEHRKQATNREYVDDSIAASDVIMNQAIEDKADAIMADLAPVLESLKYPEYDDVKNVPAHIQWMTWTDLPGQTDIPIQMLMPLDMNQKEILNVPQPLSLDNAANKGYVDESVATRLAVTEFNQTITNYPTVAEMEKHVLDYTTNSSVTGFWTKIMDAIATSASATTWTSVEKSGPAWLKTILTVPRSGIQGDLDTLTQIQGGLDMGGGRIQNLSDPLNDNDAVPYNFFKNALTNATKSYVDTEIDLKIDALDLRLSRERTAQQLADRMSSFKWSLARNGETSEFTFVMDVVAISTLAYLTIEKVSFTLKVEEIEIVNGIRTGNLVKLMEMTDVPLTALVSGVYKFTYTLPLGTTTPPISSAAAPLMLTISPDLECNLENETTKTFIYPSQIQVRKGSGVNNIALIAE